MAERDQCLAMEYRRETDEVRNDVKRQLVRDAFHEMAQQSRDLHQVTVSSRDGGGMERLRCAIDRYGATSLRRGSFRVAVDELVCPLAMAFSAESHHFDVAIAPQTEEQKSVLLVYREAALSEVAELEALCEAVRKGDGLGVSVIHLNPYLHAQILDYFTGTAVDLRVVDGRPLALAPRTADAGGTTEHMTATIFRFFAEGETKVAGLDGLQGEDERG